MKRDRGIMKMTERLDKPKGWTPLTLDDPLEIQFLSDDTKGFERVTGVITEDGKTYALKYPTERWMIAPGEPNASVQVSIDDRVTKSTAQANIETMRKIEREKEAANVD